MSNASVTRSTPPPTRQESARPWPRWGLACVQALVGINAVFGGWRLIVDGFGMPVGWLSRLPVDTWVWPGIALIVTVAIPQLVAAVVTVVNRRPAIGYWLGVAVGGALLLWIVGQVVVLGQFFFLQPVVGGLGLIEIGLSMTWRRQVLSPNTSHLLR